jgi:FkbM family methyltransferase
VGFHTLPLSRHLSAGKVVAVEANRSTFGRLKTNTQELRNVVLVHAALQDSPDAQTITFHCSTSHPGRSGVGKLWEIIAPGQVIYREPEVVSATTVDKLVEHHRLHRVDFMKLDLEGGEYNALRGATRTLADLRPLIVTEHSSQAAELNHYSMDSYFRLIAQSGYVPIAPNGDVVQAERPVPFWYVFMVPQEALAEWRRRIEHSVEFVLGNAV